MCAIGIGTSTCIVSIALGAITNLGKTGTVKTSIAGWAHVAHLPRCTFGGGLYVLKSTASGGGSITSLARNTRTSATGALLNCWQIVQWQRIRNSGSPSARNPVAPQPQANFMKFWTVVVNAPLTPRFWLRRTFEGPSSPVADSLPQYNRMAAVGSGRGLFTPQQRHNLDS